MAKEEGVVAGLEVAAFVFEVVDASLTCELLAADGDAVTAGQRVLRIAGLLRAFDRGAVGAELHPTHERPPEQRHHGLVPAPMRVLDTRKLRRACGNLRRCRASGGTNHRMACRHDVVKDNHVDYAGSWRRPRERRRVHEG